MPSHGTQPSGSCSLLLRSLRVPLSLSRKKRSASIQQPPGGGSGSFHYGTTPIKKDAVQRWRAAGPPEIRTLQIATTRTTTKNRTTKNFPNECNRGLFLAVSRPATAASRSRSRLSKATVLASVRGKGRPKHVLHLISIHTGTHNRRTLRDTRLATPTDFALPIDTLPVAQSPSSRSLEL